MAKGIFDLYNRADSYDKRLAELVENGRKELREADHKAILSLREDRGRLLELVARFQRLRKAQAARDKADRQGISKAQGLELLIYEADQLERAVDAEIETTLEELDR